MAEKYSTPESQDNWSRRRRLLLDMMAEAFLPLMSRGLLSRETNGWAFWVSLNPMEGDASLNKARYDWEKPNTMVLIVRLRNHVGFSVGKFLRRETDIEFVPGTSILTVKGEAAATKEIDWLVTHLASGTMPEAILRPVPTGKPKP